MGTIEYAKKRRAFPEFGTPVKTIVKKETVIALFYIKQKFIDARQNIIGRYTGYVLGTGGAIWWIEHEDKTIGAYWFDEVFDKNE